MRGHLHPLTLITEAIIRYFEPFGFEVCLGQEIVTTEENFDSLNIPNNHPARKEMDTFYLPDGKVLRTHTSALYLKEMRRRQPPVRLLFPGRAFRNEATDATHNTVFYQIDGLVVDDNTNLGHLIASLEGLFRELLGERLEFRIRAGHFPFTEPSIELDLKMIGGKWLEMLGAGMVNPNVIRYWGYDPKKVQGYAFGIGLERVLNVVSGVNDIRYNTAGDYRFLGQY